MNPLTLLLHVVHKNCCLNFVLSLSRRPIDSSIPFNRARLHESRKEFDRMWHPHRTPHSTYKWLFSTFIHYSSLESHEHIRLIRFGSRDIDVFVDSLSQSIATGPYNVVQRQSQPHPIWHSMHEKYDRSFGL